MARIIGRFKTGASSKSPNHEQLLHI
jgi:hypothetical protein